MKKEDEKDITKKRIIVLSVFIFILFLVLIFRISYLQLFDVKASVKKLEELSTKTVYGPSMPRGRILDRNYNVIVDNEGINVITYKKESGTTTEDEIEMAYELAQKLDVSYTKLKDEALKDFWIVNNEKKADSKITNEERELYERRKLSSDKKCMMF